jgi:hypothetical protein
MSLMLKHRKYLVSKEVVHATQTERLRVLMLQSRRGEVVLVPQELIVLNDTASDIKQGLALELSCDGMDPGSINC